MKVNSLVTVIAIFMSTLIQGTLNSAMADAKKTKCSESNLRDARKRATDFYKKNNIKDAISILKSSLEACYSERSMTSFWARSDLILYYFKAKDFQSCLGYAYLTNPMDRYSDENSDEFPVNTAIQHNIDLCKKAALDKLGEKLISKCPEVDSSKASLQLPREWLDPETQSACLHIVKKAQSENSCPSLVLSKVNRSGDKVPDLIIKDNTPEEMESLISSESSCCAITELALTRSKGKQYLFTSFSGHPCDGGTADSQNYMTYEFKNGVIKGKERIDIGYH